MALAATLAAPFLLYLIVRMIPAPLPPVDPLLAARVEMYKSIMPNYRVREPQLGLARSAALHAPLALEPFFLHARAAEQRGDYAAAIRLMEEVRRRRPNFEPGRLQLAAYYGATNQFRRMFDEIDVALSLNFEVRQAVVAELTRLIAIPEGRDELAAALARNPSWRRDFFLAASARPFVPADALALFNSVRSRNPPFPPSLEYRLYLESLVRVGQVARARQLWLGTLAPDRRSRHTLLFDGSFSGERALQPFGWHFRNAESGRAEILRDGGRPHLAADYFGGTNEVLAEQIIALTPGNYRLRYIARSESGVGGADIYWAINCFPRGPQVLRNRLLNLSGNYSRHTASFSVPAGCGGQQLRLVGEPLDISVPITVQIAAVEIAR